MLHSVSLGEQENMFLYSVPLIPYRQMLMLDPGGLPKCGSFRKVLMLAEVTTWSCACDFADVDLSSVTWASG